MKSPVVLGLFAVSIVALVVGAVVGFMPVTAGSEFADVKCGSAFTTDGSGIEGAAANRDRQYEEAVGAGASNYAEFEDRVRTDCSDAQSTPRAVAVASLALGALGVVAGAILFGRRPRPADSPQQV